VNDAEAIVVTCLASLFAVFPEIGRIRQDFYFDVKQFCARMFVTAVPGSMELASLYKIILLDWRTEPSKFGPVHGIGFRISGQNGVA